jgi:hypothetical protein
MVKGLADAERRMRFESLEDVVECNLVRCGALSMCGLRWGKPVKDFYL